MIVTASKGDTPTYERQPTGVGSESKKKEVQENDCIEFNWKVFQERRLKGRTVQ